MPNELADCASPYLRQHADNPVAWKPWSEAALAEAVRRDVPLLISSGYATCHWCHVMAHETFEDGSVAGFMNAHFVCIKVDREEHPEVDSIYMDAIQALTGHGGWPLNAIAMPDGRPFYACTYLPNRQWVGLLTQLATVWRDDRSRCEKAAQSLLEHLADPIAIELAPVVTPSEDPMELAWQRVDAQLEQAWDDAHPGLAWSEAAAPKFPATQVIPVLLEHGREAWRERALATLTAMQDSGLHDRVGGGFHRYSVDREWRVPHFEKMLYDNAQLLSAYALSAARTQRSDHRRTARSIGEYLLRDLRIGNGFATAEDADDDDGEGAFYAWSPDQLRACLGEETAQRLIAAWDLSPGRAHLGRSGHAEPVPSHIPHPRGADLPSIAQHQNLPDVEALRQSWEPSLPLLRAARATRPRPIRDDKILTDLNALALESFAALNAIDPSDARWLATCLMLVGLLDQRRSGGLLRMPGRAATVSDYGCSIMALPTAFDQSGQVAAMDLAEALADEAIARLRMPSGGFFSVGAERRDLIRRGHEQTDHAVPCGENALALGFSRLAVRTGLQRWRTLAEQTIAAGAAVAARAPLASATRLRAWRTLRAAASVVIVGPLDDPLTHDLAATARSLPAQAVVIADSVEKDWPLLDARRGIAHPAALLCRGELCLAPLRSTHALRSALLDAQP